VIDLQTGVFLLADHAFDLAILDFLEYSGDFAAGLRFSRASFSAAGAQQTADVVGAEGWFGTLSHFFAPRHSHCHATRRRGIQ
jgi:hypothetical protein